MVCLRVALAVVASAFFACGTVTSYASGCPGPLSGVLTDTELLRRLDATGNQTFDWLVITPDLPLSALADLLSMPIAMALEHPPPAPVSPGCYWATEGRDPVELGDADEGQGPNAPRG